MPSRTLAETATERARETALAAKEKAKDLASHAQKKQYVWATSSVCVYRRWSSFTPPAGVRHTDSPSWLLAKISKCNENLNWWADLLNDWAESRNLSASSFIHIISAFAANRDLGETWVVHRGCWCHVDSTNPPTLVLSPRPLLHLCAHQHHWVHLLILQERHASSFPTRSKDFDWC